MNSSNLNPYDILDVPRSASNAEIAKASAKAMKLRQHPANVIAQAQKCLLNSQKRLLADYLCPILSIAERFKRQDISILDSPISQLELLPLISEIDVNVLSADNVLKLDKEIGQFLFSVDSEK